MDPAEEQERARYHDADPLTLTLTPTLTPTLTLTLTLNPNQVRTTQLIFGLARAGWPLAQLKNYDGSWVEWSHLALAEEIATGEE